MVVGYGLAVIRLPWMRGRWSRERHATTNGFPAVCPYTIISFILSSFMIECRDLALNHLLKVGGSWDSFEPNGTGLTSRITPTLLGIAHIGVGGHHLSAKTRYKQI